MDLTVRVRIINAKVDAERDERRGEGDTLCGEDWRHRCEVMHVLRLSPEARERYLHEVARVRNPSGQ